jgi:NADH-quinone oxidoreductase subunit E
MSVRRLGEHQPANFAFSEANLAWAKSEIAKYPEGRQASAVISLLWRAQEQEGWVSEPAIRAVAELLGMARIRVLEIATFYTMFHLEPVGAKAHIQVCGTTPCWLRGADDLKRICRERINPEQFHLSKDGAFSWEEVECVGACVNAPLVQINADTYEDLTADSFNGLLDDVAAGRALKPGPQIERQFSAPVGGPTTLTGEIYRPGPQPWTPPRPPEPAVTDADAKKPTAGASVRESPEPKPPVQNNPEDKKPNPVSKV